MTNEQEKSEKTADELERELTEKENAEWLARMIHAHNVEIEEEEREKRWRRMWGDDYQDYVIEYVFD